MNMRQLGRSVSTLALLLAVSSSAPGEESFKLEYKPANGSIFEYTIQANRTITNKSFETSSSLTSNISVEVTSKVGGVSDLLIVPSDFKASGTTAVGEWNSEEDYNYSLNGKELREKVLRNGVSEPELFLPARPSEPVEPGTDSDLGRTALIRMAPDLQSLSIPFSENEVSLGDTWQAVHVPIGADASQMIRPIQIEATLESVEESHGIRCAKIGLKYGMRIDDLRTASGPMTIIIKEVTWDGIGTSWVSLEDGHLVKSDLSISTSATMETAIAGEVTFKTTQDRALDKKV